MIGQTHDKIHVVLNEKNSEALVAQLAKHLGQFLFFLVAQPGGGLVKQQQHRIGSKRPRDLQDALLAESQVAGEFIQRIAKPDPL